MATHRHLLLQFLLTLLCIPQDLHSKRLPSKPKLQLLPGRLLPRIDFFHNCENISTLTFLSTNTHLKTSPNNGIVIDTDFVGKRLVEQITKVVFLIYSCEDRASGKCQLFQTWRFGKEYCRMMEMKNEIWSPLYQNINPRMKCPITPGQYFLRNGTLDMRLIQVLPYPLEQYYWRIRAEFYEPELYSCVAFGTQVLRSHS